MTQLQNQRNVTLSHVCVSMQSVQYCSSHLSHMDIFSGSDLVQQRAQTSPSSPTTSSSSLSSCVGAVHTCAGTCSHGPYGGYRTCLRIKNCCKCKSPGFLNSTGRLGPKRGRKCYITPAFSGVPNKGGQNQNSKPPLRVTMMPLGAPSISKYWSPVRPGAQIVALRAHCA